VQQVGLCSIGYQHPRTALIVNTPLHYPGTHPHISASLFSASSSYQQRNYCGGGSFCSTVRHFSCRKNRPILSLRVRWNRPIFVGR